MTSQTTYISFLVRLWREQAAEPAESDTDWHAEVEHIQSGRRWTFDTIDEWLDFLRRQAETPDESS